MADKEKLLKAFQPSWKAYYEFIAAGIILLWFGGLGLLVLLYMWYDKATSTYTITNKRVVVEKGLFWKNVKEIKISKIKDVFLKQDTIQKALDVGSLRITSTVEDENPVEFKKIEDPAYIRDTIRKLMAGPHAAAKK